MWGACLLTGAASFGGYGGGDAGGFVLGSQQGSQQQGGGQKVGAGLSSCWGIRLLTELVV